jgi:hypothetical protein
MEEMVAVAREALSMHDRVLKKKITFSEPSLEQAPLDVIVTL